MMLAIVVLAIAGRSFAQTGYRMTGMIEGVNEGNIYLIRAAGEGKLDTLARDQIKQGKFEFTGEVKEPGFTRVYLEGNNRTVTFFLENADYTARINLRASSHIEGGYEQSVQNEFSAIEDRKGVRRMRFMKDVSRAETKEQADSLDKWRGMTPIFLAAQAEEENVIKFNPNSQVAVQKICSEMGFYVPELTKKRFELLSAKNKASKYGKRIREYLAMRDRTDEGCIAPDFTLTDLKGKKFNMYGVEGKVKVIVCWNPGMDNIRVANKMLEEIYQEYRDKGLEIVNVIQNGDRKMVTKIAKEDKLTYKQGIVAGEELDSLLYLYGEETLRERPLFVLDGNNRILYKTYYMKNLKASMPTFFK